MNIINLFKNRLKVDPRFRGDDARGRGGDDLRENSPIPYPYGDFDILLKYKPNPRSKRLSLRMSSKEKMLILTLPPRVYESQIQDFLRRCVPWVSTQLQKQTNGVTIYPGSCVRLHGAKYTCLTDPLRRKPILCHQSQTLRLPNQMTKKSLHLLLKETASEHLRPIVETMAQTLGLSVEKVTFKDTKSRWGSCSSQRTITLNWRLIFAPPEVAYYVCAHEVAHLLHMNHSKEFWKVVEAICPTYKTHRKWLKTNGASLMGV